MAKEELERRIRKRAWRGIGFMPRNQVTRSNDDVMVDAFSQI